MYYKIPVWFRLAVYGHIVILFLNIELGQFLSDQPSEGSIRARGKPMESPSIWLFRRAIIGIPRRRSGLKPHLSIHQFVQHTDIKMSDKLGK